MVEAGGVVRWLSDCWRTTQSTLVCALLNSRLESVLASPLLPADFSVRSADNHLIVVLGTIALRGGVQARDLTIDIPWADNGDCDAAWQIRIEHVDVDVCQLAQNGTEPTSVSQVSVGANDDIFFAVDPPAAPSTAPTTSCLVRRQCAGWFETWFSSLHIVVTQVTLRCRALHCTLHGVECLPSSLTDRRKTVRVEALRVVLCGETIAAWQAAPNDGIVIDLSGDQTCVTVGVRSTVQAYVRSQQVQELREAFSGAFPHRNGSGSSVAACVNVSRVDLHLESTQLLLRNVTVRSDGCSVSRMDLVHSLGRVALHGSFHDLHWASYQGCIGRVALVYKRRRRPPRCLARTKGDHRSCAQITWSGTTRSVHVALHSPVRAQCDPETLAATCAVARSLIAQIEDLFPLDCSHLSEDTIATVQRDGKRCIARDQCDDECRDLEQSLLVRVSGAPDSWSTSDADNLYTVVQHAPETVDRIDDAVRLVRVVVGNVDFVLALGEPTRDHLRLAIQLDRVVYEHARVPSSPADMQALHVHSVVSATLRSIALHDHVAHSHWRKAFETNDMRIRCARKCRYARTGIVAWAWQTSLTGRADTEEHTLRLRLHQGTLDYGYAFVAATRRWLARLHRSATDVVPSSPSLTFERVDVARLRLVIDYKPRTDRALGRLIQSPDYVYVARALPVEEAVLHLRAVHLLHVPAETLGRDLMTTYVPNYEHVCRAYLAGVQPVRIVIRFARGAFDLVRLPVRAATRGDNAWQAFDAGMRTLTLELLEMGARAATITHKLLHAVEASDATAYSRQRNEPSNLGNGLWQAGGCVARGVSGAVAAVTSDPYRAYVDDGAWGLAAAAVCAVPRLVVRPVVGVTSALARMTQGAANELDPDRAERVADKYK